ncbi:MAG: phosphoribosyl-AMP cyclohydrolase [Candidatus Omnitrophica bacterium CG11_big_fil_rev_8_21_14_0_20_45_26]|uniref:Phosphoribosyl-AMP cyclohydrolase n=1 Tax=Candidatus Abzuiibacterium crystallinum TaxID=1974748 RepID=A0A2H0LQH8_9BACT|nr:MAG: phosphoribosyl-AMP cyclohydrolase [Candidatus Omnitrophica bacterium CG11_big_fil_rev_8_21_14_0_20_45_26]PIW63966.1 MAG: phosphoribosyl-AMP cyclohydrolase [Candidatus Omnitrophica bacterium CG12_big_fil_rev_8_21_14_0_65_45_16]
MIFGTRGSKTQIEEGTDFSPKFDQEGLIPVVTSDYASGTILMQAYMNQEALAKSIEMGEAVYYSRSRKKLWHKGEESGHIQKIREILIDCDQDCIWLRVDQIGDASCHVGYRSCFYRVVPTGSFGRSKQPIQLKINSQKVFDPKEVYKQSKDTEKS